MGATPLLRLDEVETSVPIEEQSVPVIKDVCFTINRHEIVGLVGESGSGKSMTARSILRLLPSGARTTGRIELDGEEIPHGGEGLRRIRAERIAMIFQDPRAHVDPLYRNGDHVAEGLRVHKGLGKVAARERALELLESVGITHGERVLDAYPGEVSGGMLQRIMIAGALAGDPDLLIADEPTTALDVTIQSEILAILDGLRRERGLAVLFITHDLEVAATLCDRVIVMYAGRVMEEQSARELFRAPRHPYTAGLLGARPDLDGRAERLTMIPGRPPALAEDVQGCPFHPRCQFEEAACRAALPPLVEFDGARTACRRIEEIEQELQKEAVVHD